MTVAMPSISALYAALLGLFAAVLTVRVILNRVKTGIQAADGGNARLGQAIRAHANFAEQVPLALLLIVLAELAGTPGGIVHALGAALVVARLANAWGLSRSLGPTMPRQAGAGLTVLVVAAASLLLLYRLLAAH
ncbi:Inner membrane protein YecN [Variovorax sp. SRS16]|nr:Inner membrane protein YecN [Variovorax sp. SRS16]